MSITDKQKLDMYKQALEHSNNANDSLVEMVNAAFCTKLNSYKVEVPREYVHEETNNEPK